MSLCVRRWVACDHKSCTATFDQRRQAHQMALTGRPMSLRMAAELEGWAFTESKQDLCAYHRELALGASDQPALFGASDVHHEV